RLRSGGNPESDTAGKFSSLSDLVGLAPGERRPSPDFGDGACVGIAFRGVRASHSRYRSSSPRGETDRRAVREALAQSFDSGATASPHFPPGAAPPQGALSKERTAPARSRQNVRRCPESRAVQEWRSDCTLDLSGKEVRDLDRRGSPHSRGKVGSE